MTEIKKNLEKLYDRLARAAQRAGRDPGGIKVVAVSKNQTAATIREGVQAGIKILGENRVQEFLEKYEAVEEQAEWHFIGHLQTNKVKYIVDKVQLIHSLDNLPLTEEIDKRAGQKGLTVKALVQVNISGENSKFGLAPKEVASFLETVSDRFGNIEIQGLMTIAPLSQEAEVARTCFRGLRKLADSIRERNLSRVHMDYLSMGMTNDFEIAVEEGSNIVRIGRAIFGDR